MPAQVEYSAPAWGGSPFADLALPSGGTVLARKIDMAVIINAGLMEEFDAISPAVDEKVVAPAKGGKLPNGKTSRPGKKLTKAEAKAAEEAATKAMLANKGEMAALGRILALMIPAVIVKPKVESSMVQSEKGGWVTLDPADREDGVIYTDTIPMSDQMFILQWAMQGMDMSEAATFREQSESAVDDVENGEGSGDETE